mmetsp:Transcript_2780/g.4185  ORF Transcript_2780/g.4185 Transcript_2780/m.4185 type:complete len:1583 (-) Transcript_2780:264-5012(-)|eukprot:CAMPEP_0185020166 /NCGR_PEP_ID=MMETSP1103-20130426/2762_1 /TAXON_ID=36769 /ORGANISM="Paraphysomonas bandaiensis, Strain Caron Lab Isolate" /LENGTH=1582 /DNA_ID=CAMNT_0027550899 /DNA_START=115 /DNA_END=4863 /DNA_ORIENTATION=-
MSKKEKAQVHSGYRSAVFSTDTSGCIALGGILSKKNSHGYWQKRYFYFNNEFLIYKKDKGSSDIKGVIDLGELAKYNSCGRGELSLVMKGGEVLDLKGSDEYEIAQWIAAIEERMQWVEKDLEIINASHELPGDPLIAPDTLLVSGWLMKKSPHPYGGMQERFVRVEGTYLKYFKNEGRDKDALGSVSLETADWVRPYDSSPECKVFEVQAQKRVFTFQAESASEMHRWVSGIEEGIKCAKKLLERHALAKEVAATPFRIRLFDEKGATELRSLIREDLEELYPTDIPPAEGEEWVRVGDHLVAACQILDYLDDLLMEVAKVTGSKPKPMRLDVLAVGLLEINSFLSLRLTPVVTPELMVPSQINLGDVHNVIDWLTNYQARLSDIYCPPLEPDGPDPLSFPLIDNIPQLCEWYVRGAPGLVGAATHLKEHAKKVWDTLEENPAETLETHQDGTFYTHAPTDTWELFHHHISLATSTKAPLLEFMVAETIVENIEFVIQLMTSYVEGMYKPNPDANYREIELELVCGLVNDLQLHKNELDAVTKKFTWLDEIKRRVDALFEVEAANIKYTTLTCLRRISALIMEDIDEPLQEIFTPTWLGTPPPTEPPVNPSSQISVAIATINDYLNDLKQFVVSNRYPDLVDLVMEALVIRYFRSVMKIQDSPSPTKPREKKGTMFGKELSIKGMLGQGLRATEISVTLIENDTNAIHDFFKPKSDNVKAYWTVLDDLVQLLIMDPEEMSRLLMSRISQCPPAAQAIVECSKRCAALRDDLERDEVESIFLPLEPMLKVHNELEVDNEYLTLCGLYCNLGLTQKKSTLSRKLLSMATVPLIRGASMQESSSSPMPQDRHQQFQKSDAGRTSNVDDVLSVLKSDEDVRRELIREEEEEYEQRRIEEEEEALQAERANLYKEGWMEKKSPARHSTWQLRWFKLSTRAQQGDEGLVYTHTLFWYKKKGASSLKCHDTTSICGMQLLSSPRSLAYLTDDFNIYLAHDPEGMRGVPIKEWDAESKDGEAGPSSLLTQTHGHSFSFLLQLEGGDKGVTGGDKDVILRVKTVDDLIDWMNCLSTAAKLEYDVVSGVWMKGERKKKINPKAFLKATSLPKDARKKAALARSVSAVSTNHSSATAAARAPSALSTLDSFGDELMEEEDDEDEEDLDEEDGGEEVEEDGATERTVLHLEGTLEKQSPKNNLVWQPRYFKLVTRGPAGGTEYVLTWYKKRGASAIKSFNAGAITTMVLLRSPKPVVYNPDDFKLHMSREDRTLSGVVVKEKGSDTTSSSYIFMLSLDNSEVKGGTKKSGTDKDKDVLLRIDSAEKLINWMNCLAEAASLEYDSLSGCWVKGNRIKKTNPKAFLKSSTMPLPESHDASRHTLPRSASATATAGSTVPSMPSIEDEDDYAEEEDNEGDDKSYQVDEESHQSVNSGEWNSDGDIAPPPPPPSSPPPSSPPSTQSPKQMLSTKPVETTSENVTDRLSDGSRDLHSFNSGNPRRSSNESVDDSLRNGSSAVGSDNGIECADGEEASGIDVGGIVLSGSENNSDIYPMHERESDIYSLASEGIPDDDEDDELRGDGSKPVGCTSCAVM